MRTILALTVVLVAWPVVGIAADQDREGSSDVPPVSVPLTPSLFGPGRAANLAYVGVEGRWNSVRGGPGLETTVEAPVFGAVSFRAGVVSSPIDRALTPSFLLKVDVLTQGRHGIDGAMFGGYRGEGFNLVPAVEVGIAVARRTERLTLISSVGYGQGLQQGERYGDARVAGLVRVHRAVNVGLDARARFDLELDSDEPAGEATVDGLAGPTIVVGLGRFALSGQAGMGLVAPRTGGPSQVGATTRLGLGGSF